MTLRPVHPGEVLKGELEGIGITLAELARQIGVPVNRITQILHERRAVTGDTALRLGHWFAMSPQFWLNLQTQFDLAIASKKAGADIDKLPRLNPA